MIKKIKITEKYKTIPKDFVLELEQMTVITGENNSGKTNFIKAVNAGGDVKFLDKDDKELTPEIIYIAAENIKPSDSECKSSAKTTGLIKNLSKLFSNLEIKFKLEKKSNIIKEIEALIEKANKNLESFTGSNEHALTVSHEDKLDSSVIIQALIKDIKGKENEEERKLEDLGQGTQRIIVASILKAYIDILIEKKIHAEKQILILFEEPEIYLHPKLKRALNATLEKIAEQDNHQVVITTHDPYFVFKNLEGKAKTIFSFEKKDGKITEASSDNVIYGIEDELLFIFLYSLLEEKDKDFLKVKIEGFEKRKYFRNDKSGNKKEEDQDDLKYIRHQIHHLGDNPYTKGLVSQEELDSPEPEYWKTKNYYTEKELAGAIKKMSEMLGA